MGIRLFNKNDFPAILDIYAKSKLDELIYEPREYTLIPLDKDKRRLPKLQESDIYVYEEHNILGFGALFDAEVRALFVHPNNRGRGIGTTLLKHLLSLVDEPVFLHVTKSNLPAQNMYKHFGFKVIEEFETTYNSIPVTVNKMLRV